VAGFDRPRIFVFTGGVRKTAPSSKSKMLEAFVVVIGVYGLLPRDAENNDRRKVPLATSWRSGGKHTRFAASVLTRLLSARACGFCKF
jgi:hypothetical protein